MKGLTLRHRILLLATLPLVVVVVTLMLVTRSQIMTLGEQEMAKTRDNMLAVKRETLRAEVEIARSAIESILQDPTLSRDQAQARAKAVLRSIRYGEKGDGYVFVQNYDGWMLVNRAAPQLENTEVSDLKDSNGTLIVQGLIDAARSGGGFLTYLWHKPSKNQDVEKLSYAAPVAEWNWLIGSGFYIDDIEDAVAAKQRELRDAIGAQMMSIALIGAVMLALILVIALWLTERMFRPLRETAQALREIGQGDGDLTKRLATSGRRDEVGELSEGFNSFVGKIHALVSDLKQGVDQLSASTGQLTDVVDLTHRDVQVQNAETGQVAAAIHEMAAAVQQVAGSASQAASAAQDADRETLNGSHTVSLTIDAIDRLSGEVNRAAEAIAQLDSRAAQIGSVVNVIKDIAGQTNLLALNAAIEAARAGEQGRGFSVVADEVRTLATRTQQSTDEIQNMIESLQRDARNAVSVMEAGQGRSAETVTQAHQANASLSAITGAVGTITEMNTQIASAAEQQTAVAEEISKSVQQIADIASGSMGNADRLAATAREMSELERRLLQLTAQFRI